MIRDETARQAEERMTPELAQGQPWPYGWVALALFVLIVALVGGAFVLDQRLRPPVGTEALSSGIPAVQSTTTSTGVSAVPPAGATASGVSMPSDPLQREIVNGYLRYWEVRIQAYFNLDASRLPDVMAGAELVRDQQQIQDLQAQGKAGKLDVEHHILLVDVAPDHAVVYDEYVNRSVFVDSATKRELATPAPLGTAKISYDLQKIDGTWKVTDGMQHP